MKAEHRLTPNKSTFLSKLIKSKAVHDHMELHLEVVFILLNSWLIIVHLFLIIKL